MKFGLSLPPFGDYADPHTLVATAKAAEEAGWDGFFLWDHVFFDPSFHPIADPWVALAAVAMQTSRMRIGTMVTPIARRRPWILARQTVGVDRLSNGRLTLGVGLGDPAQWEYGFFNEETDAKLRAQKLDEGLDILTGLWTGEPFQYSGTQFQMKEVRFTPRPVQQPRIPIWVAGFWPNKPPIRRAARWDGMYQLKSEGEMTPDEWRETLATVRQYRTTDAPFDAVHGGRMPEDRWDDAGEIIESYAAAGVTWWMEDASPWRFGHSWEIQWQPEFTQQVDALIRRGPPKNPTP